MATSEVWADKVDIRYNDVTDECLRLGTIEFKDFPEAFIKALRLYNKNANRHITSPQFMFNGYVYECTYYGVQSKTGRGYTHYMTVGRTNAKKMPVTLNMWSGFGGKVSITHDYILSIPKSKINDPKWRYYLE